jgi:predicted amidophosphoribosyltransferase
MVSNDKLFGCPYCGFRIGPGDERCSRCGNKFGPDSRFECPFCGDLIAQNTQECPSCHVDFAEFQTRVRRTAKTDGVDTLLMEIIRLEATEVEREGKKLSCPNCDVLLDGSESTCPRCGADLTEGAAFQCPVCGEFVAPEAIACSVCGSSFEGGRPEEDQAYVEAEHEAASNALDDILSAVGHTGPLPEPPLEEPELPPPPEPTPEIAPKPALRQAASNGAFATDPKKVKTRKLKTKPSA